MFFQSKNKMDYDLAIVGGGSAAFAAAIRAAEAGAKVLIAEKGTVGGTCVNRGCVPSKNILHAAELYHLYRTGENFPGLPLGDARPDFDEIFRQKEELVSHLRQAKYLDILEAFPSVELVNESAKFLDRETLQLKERQVRAGMFLVATGSSPAIPPIPGLDSVPYMTYAEALSPDKKPESLAIIGGGPIGLELAQAYHRLGVPTTVIEALPTVLPGHEAEISEAIAVYLSGEGITIHCDAKVSSVKKSGRGVLIEFIRNGNKETIEAEKLLVATGTKPNASDLGATEAGIVLGERGGIQVNEHMRTANKKIFAAGDVTGSSMLVTTAALQGGIAVENGLLGRKEKFDGRLVPHAVFTTPQVASVGLKEEEAKARGIKAIGATLDFKHVPRAAAVRDTRGILKLVVDEKTARIIGMHAACPQAAELIHTGLFLIKGKIRVGEILRTTFIYPTMSEAIKIAAISIKKDVTKLSCCAS